MRNGLRRWLLAGVVASLSCTLLADIEKKVAFPAGGGTDVEVVTKSGKVKSVTPYFNPLGE